MRFLKITLTTLLVVTLLFATVFYNRSSVVRSLVNDYLSQHNSVITCIDFHLNTNVDLVISRLCIDSPYAEIELIDTLIAWDLESSDFVVDNLTEAISSIKIASAFVYAKSAIRLPSSPKGSTQANAKKNTFTVQQLPELIRQQLQEVTLLTVPIDIDIRAFNYLPFSGKKNKQTQPYQGQFSVNAQQLILTLGSQNQQDIFSFEFMKKGQDINAKLSTDLAKLRPLLKQHQTVLPARFSTFLNNESWSASGKLSSQITWHKQALNLDSTLTKFFFKTSQEFAGIGAIELGATFTWQMHLSDEQLQWDFTDDNNQNIYQGNKLTLAFEQAKLIESLLSPEDDAQLITFLTDNAMSELSLIPKGSVNIDFSKQKITSDGAFLTSKYLTNKSLAEPLLLSLKDLVFEYHDESVIQFNLLHVDFSFAGQADIAQLRPYSKQPVKLKIVGNIEQQADFWQLKLGQETVIEFTQLALPASQFPEETTKHPPRVKSLISHWQGNVVIAKNDGESQSQKNDAVTFDLKTSNQISQLNLPQVIQVQDLELNAKIKGSFADIAINAQVIADNLLIASAQLTGDLHHPYVSVSAKDILLTDLLALKIKLPIELQLIDGTLNYHLSGQIKNSQNLPANPVKLTLSVKDVTGEVDGIWLQELNWQQKFILYNGQIKSLTVDVEANEQTTSNLTIAKIETATPITQLATKTTIDFSGGEVKIKVNNTQGNLLGGRFDIREAHWPFSKELPVNVKLTEIDLEKLLELDKKQGIVVTGKVSGQLPIYYDGERFLIKEGGLHNVGDGVIQVFNNPAVAELKANSTELSLAFGALENLHYHHLTSAVSMADDGYMLLVTEIKGRNPDLDNEVNLNLNLSYDLLGLLESLNITEHFESKVIKGLQKN